MEYSYAREYYEYIRNLLVVRIVLTAVVLVPALFLFAKLLRTPGYRHDSTRRWVDYTTAGFGLWALEHVVLLLVWSLQAATIETDLGWGRATHTRAYRAEAALANLETFLSPWSHVAVFLALFYAAHALTLLRTGGEPDSGAFRKGRGFALGGSVLVALLSFAGFCLYMSASFGRGSYGGDDGRQMRGLVAAVFTLACQAVLLVMAIGSVVYSAKSRNKALGTAVRKAGRILVWCSSLFLVRQVWELLSFFVGGRTVNTLWFPMYFIDFIFGSCLSFVILVLLYVVATKASYSMSKAHYRSKVSTENLDA